MRRESLLLGAIIAATLSAGMSNPAAARRTVPADAPPAGWVAIGYRDLLDPGAIVRTGARLLDALGIKDLRGAVQPFVEGYSALLPHALTMLRGPDERPFADVADRFPPGLPQPAWAALLRAGRFWLTADGHGRARLFLPGDDPAVAWRGHYPLVRHALAGIAPPGGAPLEIEIYAFRNRFEKAELWLNSTPRVIRRRSFGPDRDPLDLEGLRSFFASGGRIEGGELDPEAGLVLYATRATAPTLSSTPVTLADLAVAYRAAFHAGDNGPFVSLDTHPNPLLSAVNFGGHLEDTRLGEVVLAADRRFKTFSAGLDPAALNDVREKIRMAVPGFMTAAERGFLDSNRSPTGVWTGTRFWFYPDSVGVDEDPGHRFAAITHGRFTADVERLGADAAGMSPGKRRSSVPSEVRETIGRLNRDYDRYAAAFPELGELSTAARLMVMAAWLKRVSPARLDLDALLSVELPAVSTPRETPKMIVTAWMTSLPSEKPTEEFVRRNAKLTYLTPSLDRTVGEGFRDPEDVSVFLALRAGSDPSAAPRYLAEAGRIYTTMRERRLRDLLSGGDDLIALLKFIARELRFPAPPGAQVPDGRLRADQERMRFLEGRLDEIRAGRSGDDEAALRAEHEALRARYHDTSRLIPYSIKWMIEITGGVNLRPASFSVRQDSSSEALRRLMARAGGGGNEAGWISSRRPGRRKAVAPPPAPRREAPPLPIAAGKPTSPRPAPSPARKPAPPPTDAAEEVLPAVAAPRIPALREVAVAPGPNQARKLVGRIDAAGRIVFTGSP